MINSKRITIAIPSYNQPEHLRECLESIARQTVIDKIEVIIFNDPSSHDEDIRKVVNNCSRLKIELIMNKERLGANDNIQQAANYSYTTPYVMMFHHDDTMAPHYVETCLKLLDKHPEAAWVSSDFNFRKGGGMWNFPSVSAPHYEVYKDQADIVRAILKNRRISFGSTTYRVERLKELIFDFDRFAQCNDRPALISAAQNKHALFIACPLINYRLHSAQDSYIIRPSTGQYLRALMVFYRSHLPLTLSLKDYWLFYRFSTNGLLESFTRIVPEQQSFAYYIQKAKKEKLLKWWCLNHVGIRALIKLFLKKYIKNRNTMNPKVIILTKLPQKNFLISLMYSQYFVKYFTKKCLFYITKNPRFNWYGGPDAVLKSLQRGLQELGVPYLLNPNEKEICGKVYIPSGVDVLRWAFSAKENGKIQKIICGPNVAITPDDHDRILLNKGIDVIIEPSMIVKKSLCYSHPDICKKIRVWAAGTPVLECKKEKKQEGLLYKKNPDPVLFSAVTRFLKEKNIKYSVIEYGKYHHKNYLAALSSSHFMIYLSRSESQGIALHEAWMSDVPTFVWDEGYRRGDGRLEYGENINAPYLTQECGMRFRDQYDFVSQLNVFMKNIDHFRPREYSLKNFTDKICAERFLEIFNEHE